MPASLLSPALGALLIAVTLFDIVATVLHPQVESPLSNRLHRAIWRVLRLPEARLRQRARYHALLNWGLPLMIAGLIALWLLLLLVGFALLYFPWIADPAVFAVADSSDHPLVEALYFSGATLTTVGFGDIHPVAWPFRLVALTEAASGLIVVSLSVAYLLAVYPALSRKRAAGVALDAEVAGQADTLPMVRRYLVEDRAWTLELTHRLRELGLELLAITDSHETHPVLYYAHPFQVQHSFLRILITVQNLVAALRYGLAPDDHRDVVRNPQLLLLEQSLHYSLRRLGASMHLGAIEQAAGEAEHRRYAEEYEWLCGELEALGLVSARASRDAVPVLVSADAEGAADGERQRDRPATNGAYTYTGEPDLLDPALDLSSTSSLGAYIAFRRETDPYIAAYAAASGYALDEARRDYGTIWWVGGPEAGRR